MLESVLGFQKKASQSNGWTKTSLSRNKHYSNKVSLTPEVDSPKGVPLQCRILEVLIYMQRIEQLSPKPNNFKLQNVPGLLAYNKKIKPENEKKNH